MGKKIKWGIIGLGKIAEKFAQDLKHVEDAELLAVASSKMQKAQDFAIKHNASFAFGHYEEIFESGIDVVYIATPHIAHHYYSMKALEKKIAVLCEKPFAMNEEQVSEMIEMAKKNDVFLMEAMWTRFLPSTIKVLELINEGKIGEIVSIQADFGFKAPFEPEKRALNRDLGGGAFLDIGIYPAFLSLLLLDYPTSITAESIFGKTGVDMITSFIYKYDAQSTALLNCTFEANTKTEANIYGSKGSIYICPRFHESKQIILYQDNQEPVKYEFPRETFGYNYEIQEVNICLLNGLKESPLMPLSLSTKLIHLLDKTRSKAGIKYNL